MSTDEKVKAAVTAYQSQPLSYRSYTLLGDENAAVTAAADAPVPENDLTRVLAKRGTVRSFKPDPVPEAWVNAIIDYGMRAPTSGNMETYSIIVVKDPEKRKQLATLAGGQQHVVDCPLYFALCADLNRLSDAIAMHDKQYEGRSFESCLVSSMDAALVGMTMNLVADSFGLASVMIGAMRNNAVEVAKVLNLPPRCYVVFGMCVGFPKANPLPKPRHARSGVVHVDAYDPKLRAKTINDYDKELADYYRRRGVESPDAAWSKVLSDKMAKDSRKKLKQELISLGFPLE